MKDFIIIKQKKLMLQEAFCISLALTIGIILEISLKFSSDHGYWIPMTIAIIFLLPSQGYMVKKSSDRILGTFLGLVFGFLYINIFMYSDYRWGYLLPVIWFVLFYIYFMSGNYCITVILITMFIPIIYAVLYPTAFSVGSTLARRLIFTGMGVAIALICEFTIYKRAALSTRKLRSGVSEYFRTVGGIVRMSNECFIEHKVPSKEYKMIIKKMMASISSIENNYKNFRFEIEYDENQKEIFNYLFQSIELINFRLRKILCIVGHSKLDVTAYDKEEFLYICKMIEDKFHYMRKYMHGRKDDTSEILKSFIENNSYNKFSTLLYAKEMYELSKTFDELTGYIYKKKYSS
ncbi:MAG: FUSC family protein [bacterium]|nr:FUSC family protein [bacterium]